MRVVHVLRKPLSEGTVAANTLRHGTGGLNIDASRIGSSTRTNSSKAVKGNREVLGPSSGGGGFAHGTETVVHNHGRWPANVILSHLDGCRRTGTRAVKGYQINRFTDGAKHFGGAAGHAYEGMAMEGGVETVWACAPGCPVRALDEQTGELGNNHRESKANGSSSIWGSGKASPTTSVSDAGGASRFFKQVGGRDE